MTPSPYQEKVYKGIRLAHSRRKKDQQSNLIVSAVAGSGKSTTLRGVAEEYLRKYPGHKVLILAFNVHIVNDMKERLGDHYCVDIETTHRAGLRTLKENGYGFNKFQIKASKYFYIAKDLIEKECRAEFLAAYKAEEKADDVDSAGKIKRILRKACSQLTDLTSKVMITLTDPSDESAIYDVISRFNVECNDICVEYVKHMIKRGMDAIKSRTMASFDDMLYAPLYLKCKFKQYDIVLVDECQDLNASQLQLVRRFSKRAIIAGFGDPGQAIMSFAGAMSDSINQFEEVFDARYYDLPVCYRCDKAILRLARILVPHILDRDGAKEGKAEMINYSDVARTAQPGDYVLCRLTAPLVSACISFIRIGKPARVKGRDIGFKLTEHYQTVVDLYPEARSINDFLEAFKEYKNNQIGKLIAKKSKEQVVALVTDELDSVLAIAEYVYDKSENQTHHAIGKHIKDMFDDEITKEFVLLCSAHRSKGLEANRVFILEFDKMPFKWKGVSPTGENLRQEINLIYVAITRAMKELYFVKTATERSIEDIEVKLTSLYHSLSNGSVGDFIDPSDRTGAFRND